MNSRKPYLTTFKVSDKNSRKVTIRSEWNSTKNHPVEHFEAYKKTKCIRVLQGTDFNLENGRVIPQNNGFVSTVVHCYNNHHNLVIRPDDVWLSIMTQLSFYINKHAEKFRNKFVNFDGKRELCVCLPGGIDSAPYDLCVKLMNEEMHKNLVDDKVKGWVLPNFSTTTENDLVTTGIVFMASMKKYFKYKFGFDCGIPSVTLDGTLEDWEEIVGRIEKLREYELEDWVDLLEPIMKQFVRAKSGDVDSEFWNKICSNIFEGSGTDYLSGWITTFCRFEEDGKRIGVSGLLNWDGTVDTRNVPWTYVDTNDIPNGWVQVDVTIDDNGTEYKSVMFAGHFASTIVGDGEDTLQPSPGWAMILKHPLPGEIIDENAESENEDDYY